MLNECCTRKLLIYVEETESEIPIVKTDKCVRG